MPWNSRDANKFTKSARSQSDKEDWARIANRVLHNSADDEGKAVRIANSVIAKKHAAKERDKS
ncbi:MAG: hypothetical protein ACREEE_17850 [Dongiaceae bacterium]